VGSKGKNRSKGGGKGAGLKRRGGLRRGGDTLSLSKRDSKRARGLSKEKENRNEGRGKKKESRRRASRGNNRDVRSEGRDFDPNNIVNKVGEGIETKRGRKEGRS